MILRFGLELEKLDIQCDELTTGILSVIELFYSRLSIQIKTGEGIIVQLEIGVNSLNVRKQDILGLRTRKSGISPLGHAAFEESLGLPFLVIRNGNACVFRYYHCEASSNGRSKALCDARNVHHRRVLFYR